MHHPRTDGPHGPSILGGHMKGGPTQQQQFLDIQGGSSLMYGSTDVQTI